MTSMLANLADELVSVDLSMVALERAREQCSELRNVTFEKMDLAIDPLPDGLFDCILCAGVLVYLPMDVQQIVCRKMVASLPSGGELLLEHSRKAFPGEVAGLEVHSLYRRNPELSEIHNHDEDEYAISLFCRVAP